MNDNTTEGIAADFSNKNQKKIFELSFGEFNVSWPTKDNIVLLTKPSAKAEGFLYFLNPKTGSMTRILGGIKGLTAVVSPDGEKIVFSGLGQDGTEAKIYDVKSKTVSSLGFVVFADKCVWGKKKQKYALLRRSDKEFPVPISPMTGIRALLFLTTEFGAKILQQEKARVF